MKKKDFTKIALTGLYCGILANSTAFAESDEQKDPDYQQRVSENKGYHLMTEKELFLYLNHRSRKLYNNLSSEGKKLALKVASSRCNGTNECKGLNACQTAENDCAGKGGCKGKGKCALADKNLAVKLVAKKMADKRRDSLKSR